MVDYDCVIVPHFGGFVTNYRPASIVEESGIANPPGKAIRFNKNLTQSDGLLERALATGAKISFEEAGLSLKKTVDKYWSKLNGGEKVTFSRIGVLYIDEHKKLQFEPAGGENYLKASFGLNSFSVPPIAQPLKAAEAATSNASDAGLISISASDSSEFKRSKSMYWVAAAALAPFIALSLYIGLTTNFKSPTELTFAELIPFKKSTFVPTVYRSEDLKRSASSANLDFEGENFPEKTAIFPYAFDKNEVDSEGIWVNLKKEEENRAATVGASMGPYYIIVGCFGVESNAEKFVDRLIMRGYEASILDYHKELHRVEIENFNDFNRALTSLRALRNNGTFPNAWLLKKIES